MISASVIYIYIYIYIYILYIYYIYIYIYIAAITSDTVYVRNPYLATTKKHKQNAKLLKFQDPRKFKENLKTRNMPRFASVKINPREI